MRNVWLTYVYYGITAVSIVVVILSVKYLLGGYDKVSIVSSEAIDYVIAGKYIDDWSDEEKQAFEQELNDRLVDGKMRGKMIEVLFFSDSLDKAVPTEFMGIAMQGSIVTIPSGYKVVDIYEPEALEVLLTMHRWVRPSYQDLRNQMEDKSKEEGKNLDERLLLFSGQNDSLTVIAGIR